MISENQVGEILSRRHGNESISHIARTMSLSRPTVSRYVNMLEEREGSSSVAIASLRHGTDVSAAAKTLMRSWIAWSTEATGLCWAARHCVS